MTARPAADAEIEALDPQLRGLPGIAEGVTQAFFIPSERTYTQSEVEKFFARAESVSAELDTDEGWMFQNAMKFAYLKGAFSIGGAE